MTIQKKRKSDSDSNDETESDIDNDQTESDIDNDEYDE